ncbi:RagB/SusD family nutrient uptake outer membrane protein [Dyadobacter flavalbus]|uniref:RagB/SusD family nutrient uptake outer membrane protein n=1 Tax=Dyadobacter flavalbus TaxID=2579942 RepID=A0A5M8Q9G3_9BACT|nr:RagB/SusD family nutrient uptake outer membrane protein [Dyadobacter flavalbus]KAA6431584.1 RagB/SusD family nutrient uptake outer membrane protein [Dyadobacter flavalbus]
MKFLRPLSAAYFILLVALTSCNKDWLKPEPLSFFSPENVFTEKSGFESLIITMRKDLKNENTGTMPNLTMEFAASDLASPWSQLDFYNLTPNTDQYYRFLAMFTQIYTSIKNTNVLISRIDHIKWASEEERNGILAEAYWHRAYWYYRLVNSYGDVPFISKEIEGAKLDFQTHSREAILKKIQSDLEYAVQWLPVTAKAGAVSKGAGNHLLAKIYLANLEFDKAIEAANNVISGPYALMTQRFGIDASKPQRNLIWDLHRSKNFSSTQNTETILASIDRYEAPPGARSAGLYTMRLYNPQWFQPQVLDSQGKPGMVASGPMYDSLGRGNANIRLTGYYQYDIWTYKGVNWRVTPDLRRSDINWVDIDELKYNNPASVDFGKPVNTKFLAAQVDTFKHVYAIPHYIMYNPMDDPKAIPVGGNGDWYIFRLAETYLLRAEAYYWKGQFALAAADINKVRERAKALPVTAADVNIHFILDERARELFAEEPRHSELVRISYIMAKSNLGGYSLSNFSTKNFYFDRVMKYNNTYEKKIQLLGNTANMAPFHVLWPIPSLVITANTQGVINQNAGYNGAELNIAPLTTIE